MIVQQESCWSLLLLNEKQKHAKPLNLEIVDTNVQKYKINGH